MRKFTSLVLISAALLSCKKETQTVTKVDPVTGKTITVEVPVTESDSTGNVVDEVAVAPAIINNNGAYVQTFKLEKGKTYPLITYQKDVQTVTSPDGKSQSGTNETTDEMSFTVNDFVNGVYDISINLVGKKNSQSANGKSVAIDSKAAEPKDEQLKMMWKMNKALAGNKLNLKMDEKGKVISISGFEPIYSKVNAALTSSVKDAATRTQFLNSVKSSFNEKVLREQFSKNLILLPAKGVKVGDKWTQTENATPDGKVKITTNYTLKSVGNGVVVVAVAGGIPPKTDKKTQEGITRTLNSQLTQNGTITLDQNTGWIKNQNIAVKTTQAETLSDGKESQTMKSVSNSSVMVNPAGK